MKAEITPENKIKFFQLYSGQEVIWVRTCLDQKTPYQAQFINDGRDRKLATIAILKNLSSISDVDSLAVAEIIADIEHLKLDKESRIRYVKNNILFLVIRNTHVSDYLRSKCYLLPFLGLSVDEIIEAGWAKLTEV